MKERTYVDDVDRSVYDIKDEENDAYRIKSGLDASIVEKISKEKNDPVWMQNFRLQSLQIYNELKVPNWGPPIDGLNMDNIATYVRPNTRMTAKWSEVPEDIKNTFERLGIPQAERKSLAGVGAQYDSELVYHNVREEVASQGVVYTDMESAVKLLAVKKNEIENKVDIVKSSNGFTVKCSVSGGDMDLMKLDVYAPEMEQALILKKNFLDNPKKAYKIMLALLTKDKETVGEALEELYGIV